MRRNIARLVRLLVVLGSAITLHPVFAAPLTRTFVSGSGNDANPCSLVLPCRGFAAAVSAVADGGEVIVLDSAGYGTVAITKSISIIAPPGVYAGITVTSGDGIALNTGGINVTLKGLTITGLGGANGIHMTNGASLRIEDCTVQGFTASGTGGINISAGAEVVISNTTAVRNNMGIVVDGGAHVQVSNSNLSLNVFGGLAMAGPANASTIATVSESVLSANYYCGIQVLGQNTSIDGFPACTSCTRTMTVVNSTASNNIGGVCVGGAGATAFVSGTTVSSNTYYGLEADFGATIHSAQNNPATGNGTAPTTSGVTTGGVLY